MDSCEQRIKHMTGLDVRLKVEACDEVPADTAGVLVSTCLAIWKVELKDVKAKSRKTEVVIMRSLLCFLLKVRTNLSLRQIGERTGYDDHTDVVHAVKRTRGWIEVSDPKLFAYYEPVKHLFLNEM
jgi:chromosomal replication initiation ATPase DnaA